MTDIHFRIVLEDMDQNADIHHSVAYLRKKTSLADDRIRDMLAGPPRVICQLPIRDDAEQIQMTLKKMGCYTYLEQVIVDPAYPFPIPLKQQKVMKQELSKALRSGSILALFLVQLEEKQTRPVLPSMLGSFRKRLSEHLRESDTVIGIDDNRIIILGFSTGTENVSHLRDKINRIFVELLEQDVLTRMGFSLFPEEGRSLQKLLKIADQSREKESRAGDPKTLSTTSPYILAMGNGKLTPIQVCFTEARGKIFRRLLSMDPQSLLLGLSQLPREKQKEFLARLPFDSPLVPVLEEAMESQSQPVSDKAAEEDLETIIYYMELEEGLEERKKNQEEILAKLNRVEALPTLPSIANHVLMIASNPDASASDLTEVIVNDPSLTSKLLKIVNSAFYGFVQEIGTVKKAVVLLGTGEVVALAFSLATAKLFNAAHLEGAYSPKSLWHHSMCTGLIAESLCKSFPEYRKLGVFTAGLLHDFGKILLVEYSPELYGQIHVEAKRHDLPLFELEEEKFGLTHAIIGEFLASNWNLPDALVQAIAFHHQPFLASSHSQLAAIIGLADYLYYEAAAAGVLPDEFSGFSCELTSLHWTLLGQLFPGLDAAKLDEMTQDALKV